MKAGRARTLIKRGRSAARSTTIYDSLSRVISLNIYRFILQELLAREIHKDERAKIASTRIDFFSPSVSFREDSSFYSNTRTLPRTWRQTTLHSCFEAARLLASREQVRDIERHREASSPLSIPIVNEKSLSFVIGKRVKKRYITFDR